MSEEFKDILSAFNELASFYGNTKLKKEVKRIQAEQDYTKKVEFKKFQNNTITEDYLTLRNYREELSRISHNRAIIQENGMFNIYNVKQVDVDRIINRLRQLDYIEWVQKSAGEYDFSTFGIPGSMQPRKYQIYGKIKN